MLKRLLGDSQRAAIRARIRRLSPSGWVAVVGDPALATALVDDGHQVVTVDHRPRKLRGAHNPVLSADGKLPVREVDVLVIRHPGAADAIGAHLSAVRDGGCVILTGSDGSGASTAALAGGLSDIEQHGKLTIGRVLWF